MTQRQAWISVQDDVRVDGTAEGFVDLYFAAETVGKGSHQHCWQLSY